MEAKESEIKTKKICSSCGKKKRTKCFIYNKVIKKKICKMCNRKIGTNKFYNPQSSSTKMGKFSLSNDEKKVLAKKKGWKAVNQDCKALRKMRTIVRKKRKEEIKLKKEEKNKRTQINKLFIEGLIQK